MQNLVSVMPLLNYRGILMKRLCPTWVVLSLIVAIPQLGCSSGSSPPGLVDPKTEGAHIGKAGRHVVKYVTETKSPAPKNTAAIKDWAAKNNIPEGELVSTRDKEPYEIHEV